jgi:hypothetical protein
VVNEYMSAVDFGTLSPWEYPGESLVEISPAIPTEILPAFQPQVCGSMTKVCVPYLPDVPGLGSKARTAAEWAENIAFVSYIHENWISAVNPVYPAVGHTEYDTVAGHLILLS